MSAYLSPIGNEQEADSNGAPVSGALINTYLAGTTTPVATYTDAAGLVPQANPIVCNSAGYPASPIYLPAGVAVKMVFTTSVASGSVAYRPAVDNIQGVNDPAFTTTISEWTPYSGTPTFISATSFSVTGDQTLVFQINRALRTTNTGGTIYGNVTASSFAAGITTVTVANTSGVLDSGLSAVSYALLAASNTSIPAYLLGRGAGSVVNGSLAVSASAGALTVALKTALGNDPSTADPIYIPFRSSTITTGTPSILTVTAANSVVLPSSSTLGVPAISTPFRLWFVEFNDAGTPRLGAINCLSLTSGPPAIASIFPLRADALASSTAVSAASTSAQVFYTGTAVTSKAMTVLGYAEWSSGLAALGTWTAPTKVQAYAPGVPLPGDTVQVQQTQTGVANTGTTQIPLDDTIPQNTEGDQYMSQAITPTSTANVLNIEALAHLSNNVGVVATIAALFQDTTASAIASGYQTAGGASYVVQVPVRHQMRAGTVAATTFKVRGGVATAATVTFNGAGGARTMGGSLCSYLRAVEVMA